MSEKPGDKGEADNKAMEEVVSSVKNGDETDKIKTAYLMASGRDGDVDTALALLEERAMERGDYAVWMLESRSDFHTELMKMKLKK